MTSRPAWWTSRCRLVSTSSFPRLARVRGRPTVRCSLALALALPASPGAGGLPRGADDYTKGQLNELVDVVIESGAKLFVSAVGVPPAAVVQKLHGAGILVMNMIGGECRRRASTVGTPRLVRASCVCACACAWAWAWAWAWACAWACACACACACA